MNRELLRTLLRTEGPTLSMALLLGLAGGAVFGSPLGGLCVALAGLVVVHMVHAVRLLQWQLSPKQHELPDGHGLWAVIYDGALARHRQSRRRKKRLAAILKEFRASTGALPDAAVVLDSADRISWFNHAAVALLNLQSSRDIGQRVANLLRHPRFQAYLDSVDEEYRGIEMPGLNEAEQTLWLRLIPYGRQQRLLIARDITDRKRIEQMRRDFVSNASHELRTPLTVVSGYLEMMVAEARAGDEGLAPWAEPISEMQRQAVRMESIIADMLKLARLEAAGRISEREPISMARLLRDALKEAEALSDGRHAISAQIDESLGLAGQSSELQSIVGNLLSNAVRYTPEGGRIDVRWAREGEARVLEVADTGIGITPRDPPRLTERFYRADIARSRETGGTGLGLAIVKHAVERHGGQLEIDSTPGRGSRFRCRFPAAPRPPGVHEAVTKAS